MHPLSKGFDIFANDFVNLFDLVTLISIVDTIAGSCHIYVYVLGIRTEETAHATRLLGYSALVSGVAYAHIPATLQ
jgi:hypothetical protein